MMYVITKERRPHDDLSEVVLCYLPDNKATPWVTWRVGKYDGGRYWGHYFKDEAEARKDYVSR